MLFLKVKLPALLWAHVLRAPRNFIGVGQPFPNALVLFLVILYTCKAHGSNITGTL